MALDAKDIEQVKGLIGEANKPFTEQLTTLSKTVEGLPASLTENITKGLAEPLNKLVTDAVAKLPGAKPGDKGDDKGKPAGSANDAEPPAWAKGIIETQKALADQLKPIADERTQTAEQKAARTLVEKTLKEKKLGGLLSDKMRPTLERILATKPKTEAEVIAAVESERQYAATLGVKPESFGVDPTTEGGKGGTETNNEQKFIEDIRSRKPTRL